MAERERDESNKRADECYRDRYDALSVHTREGLLASEWLLRTGKAERERDEALKHIAQLEDLYGSAALRLQELGEKEVSLTPLAALFADALAEVERLKGAVAEMTRDLRKLAGDDNLPASSAAVVAMARIQTLEREGDEEARQVALGARGTR